MVGHMGVPSTVAEIQRSFWIPRLRRRVKKDLHKCIPCNRLQSRHFQAPEAALPAFRVEPARPFSKIGVDHCGPFILSGERKAWIFLITCLVTRAIHLEVVFSLDAKTTLNALRRLTYRRGPVEFVISDNAKAFVQLKQSLSELAWRTIPEASPWWGGVYERLVGTVKRSLKKSLGNSSVDEDHFVTVVSAVECQINRRPLVDGGPRGEPLTPLHFLIGRTPPPLLPPFIVTPPESTDEDSWVLGKRWRRIIQLTDAFWKRWKMEYLPMLRQWRRSPVPEKNFPQVGDLVIVEGAPSPRGTWSIARVSNLIKGQDGIVRAAEIVLRGKLTRRPLQKLFPLEMNVGNISAPASSTDANLDPFVVSDQEKAANLDPVVLSDQEEADTMPSVRSRRGRIIKKPEILDL